jgi:guanylate kinase
MEENRRRLLFIITGPSGVGKGTVVKKAFEMVEGISKVVTYTTREVRAREKQGVTYHYVSPEEFERKIKAGQLFEWEKTYGDAWYGSPRDPFESVPEEQDALLEIGAEGMKSYREAFPEAITLFLAPPSIEALRERIQKRGAGEENLGNRFKSAVEMIRQADLFDYIILNDKLEDAVRDLSAIIQVERLKAAKEVLSRNLIQQIVEMQSDS